MIYILHLDTPLHHARHYVGFSTNAGTLSTRIDHHRAGTANCHFTRALKECGITFTLARVFRGKKYDRNMERQLKRTHNAPRYCPICNPHAPKDIVKKRKNEK